MGLRHEPTLKFGFWDWWESSKYQHSGLISVTEVVIGALGLGVHVD